MQVKQFCHRFIAWSPVLVLVFIFALGILFWGSFNWAMELTNTESFCISCHEMKENVYQEYRKTVHYSNRTGVRATCPDCHVPKGWVHKVIRKIRASNELYHWAVGSIDTRKKFQAKRSDLAQHVWKSMKASDSRECRNCHGDSFMALKQQSLKARKVHELNRIWGKTCIECHQGIAHTLPKTFDKESQLDAMHRKIEKAEVACFECHEDMVRPVDNEAWY